MTRRAFLTFFIGLFFLTAVPIMTGRAEAENAKNLPTVVLVATGGTIAEKKDPDTGAVVPSLSGEDLVKTVPGLGDLARIRVEQIFNLDSSEMSPERWLELSREVDRILADPEVAGVVVTHGTDTMEEGAYFLDLTLTSDKPVVFVGAQRSASDPYTDGPDNIRDGVTQVVSPEARGFGVTVTMNQYIHPARDVRKTHTGNVMSFRSGEKGCLGYVALGRVEAYRLPIRERPLPRPEKLPRVDLVAVYSGSDGRLLRHSADTGAEGLVVEAFGLGNVNTDTAEAIRYARSKGIPVVVCTRVYYGRTAAVYGGGGGGETLREMGCLFGGDLTAAKARLRLMLALARTRDAAELAGYFQ